MAHSSPRIPRRQFLVGLGVSTVALLAACAPIAPPAPPATPVPASNPAPAQPAAAQQAPAAASSPAAQAAASPVASGSPAASGSPVAAGGPAASPAAAAAAAKPAAQASTAPPKRGGRLVVGQNYDVIHFDPAGINSTQFGIFTQVFGTLIRLDPDLKPQPELAESWDFSADRKTLTLKLRKGATFHNGKEVTADDVVATIGRYQEEKTAANIRPQLVLFKDPKALDKGTVQISFDAPLANIFDALDLMFIWDKDNFDELRNKPNGTGPFKLAEWQPGNQMRLVKHDGFYKSGLPYLDEVVLKVFPDYDAMIIALQTGAIDATSRLRARDRRTLGSDPNLNVTIGRAGITIFTLAIQAQKPPFDDRRVRQAVSFAMNRQRFVDTYLDGLGEPWCLPWPPHSPAYDAQGTKAQLQDIPRAKQLMADAGKAGGFETTLMTNRTRAGLPELSEFTRNDLAEIGIQAKIEVLEEAAWSPRYVAGDFAITPNATGRTSKHPASLFALNVNFGAQRNYEQFQSDEYKRLAALALSTFDPAESKKVYDGLNKILLDEAFCPVLAPQTNLWSARKYVQGYSYTLDDWDVMEAVWLDK